MGSAVNLAARLMKAAQLGQIITDYETYRATHTRAVFSVLAPVFVKGRRQAVDIFEPTAMNHVQVEIKLGGQELLNYFQHTQSESRHFRSLAPSRRRLRSDVPADLYHVLSMPSSVFQHNSGGSDRSWSRSSLRSTGSESMPSSSSGGTLTASEAVSTVCGVLTLV